MLTGFSGIATARSEWLYGCARICIEPEELHDGKPIERQWFDEQRVEVVSRDCPAVSKNSRAATTPSMPWRERSPSGRRRTATQ
jgi:hypothetical protein